MGFAVSRKNMNNKNNNKNTEQLQPYAVITYLNVRNVLLLDFVIFPLTAGD